MKIISHKSHKHRFKVLSDEQEFDLMKMILDKFLWLGTGLVGIGLYFMISQTPLAGMPYVAIGIGIMVVFALVIVRYFEKYS